MIAQGEADLLDVRGELGREPLFNGRAAVMGFCYGGPYAILGPLRLGYDAGIACHGSRMLDYISHLEGVVQPVCLLWGDQDRMAPAAVLDAFRTRTTHASNLEVHVLPRVQHGYMMRGNAMAFDPAAYEVSMERAFAILDRLGMATARES
jgi:carboxymethylenebutenolidase